MELTCAEESHTQYMSQDYLKFM